MKQDRARPDMVLIVLLVLAVALVLAVVLLLILRPMRPDVETGPVQKLDLQGKVWVSYGDSITDGGFWQAAVAEKFGLDHRDQGIGGTTLAGFGPLAFWQEERLTEIIAAQPALITIMGGTNDFFSDFYIGSPEQLDLPLEEKTMDNFLGAYAYIVERLQAALPQTVIVLMTTPLNTTYFSDQPLNGRENSIMDFADATAQVAAHYALPLVDMRDLYQTAAEFEPDFWDGIHPNLEGSAKISQALIDCLIDIAK